MGKKLTGKDLIRQNAQRKYQLAKTVQAERQRLVKEFSDKAEAFKSEAAKKEHTARNDKILRQAQLIESCKEVQELEQKTKEYAEKIMKVEEVSYDVLSTSSRKARKVLCLTALDRI